MARKRNRETELYVAQKTAPIIGVYDDEVDDRVTKVLRLIDAKDGDFYQPSLHPNPDAQSAWDNIAYGGVKNELQRELQAEARRYYGLDEPVSVAAATPWAIKAEQAYQGLKARTEDKKTKEAKKYKQESVEKVNPALTEEVQDSIDDLLNNKSIETGVNFDLNNNKDLDQLMLLAAAVGLAGGGGFVAGTANQNDNMTEHEAAMLNALNQHVYV